MRSILSRLLLLATFWPSCAAVLVSPGFVPSEMQAKQLPGTPDEKPVMILLHGANGPDSEFYQQQANYFSAHGFQVVLPHYFQAAKSHDATDANYEAWVSFVRTLVAQLQAASHSGTRQVVLVGYSLGASLALAAGADGVKVSAIAEWYGSLPDTFFYKMQGMPPLLILHGEEDRNIPVSNAQQLIRLCGMRQLTCASHLYPGASHGFTGRDLEDADRRTLSFLTQQAVKENKA